MNNQRPWPIAVVLLMALLGGGMAVNRSTPAGGSAAASTSPRTTSSAKSSAHESGGEETDRLLQPLLELFNVPCRHCLQAELQATKAWAVDALIVCVPDPVESTVNYRFDPVVEAIQGALAHDRYLPVKHQLPWHAPGTESNSSNTTTPELSSSVLAIDGMVMAKADLAPRPGHTATSASQEPGILLFERSPGPGEGDSSALGPDLLVVYLVGESPRYGLHQPALLEAIRQTGLIRELNRVSSSGHDRVRIVGPCYSGSAHSLARVLVKSRAQLREHRFAVISGSATAIDRNQLWQWCSEGTDAKGAEQPKKWLTFQATVAHDKALRTAILSHVVSRRLPVPLEPLRVAWLQESNTAFGAAHSERKRICNWEIEERFFLFPLDVARIRSARMGKQESNDMASALFGPSRFRLPIPFEADGKARDVLPRFTPAFTAPQAELLIDQIMNMIRAEDIHFVGISGTDVRDQLFLAHEVKRYCPDAQLLLPEGDLSYLHGGSDSGLHGALVASSYSLNPRLQSWVGASDEVIALPSQFVAGIYNAVRFLSPAHPDDQPGPTARATALLEYAPISDPEGGGASPESARTPGIWISVVGNDEVSPLDYIDYKTACTDGKTNTIDPSLSEYVVATTSSASIGRHYWTFGSYAWLLWTISLLFPLVLLGELFLGKRDFWWARASSGGPRHTIDISCCLLVWLVSAFTLCEVGIGAFRFPAEQPFDAVCRSIFLIGSLCQIAILWWGLSSLLLIDSDRSQTDFGATIIQAGTVGVSLLCVIAFAFAFFNWSATGQPWIGTSWFLFSFHEHDVWSGTSLGLPALIFSFAGFLMAYHKVPTRLGQVVRQVFSEARSIHIVVGVALAICFGWCLFMWYYHHWSLEGAWTGFLGSSGIAIVLWLWFVWVGATLINFDGLCNLLKDALGNNVAHIKGSLEAIRPPGEVTLGELTRAADHDDEYYRKFAEQRARGKTGRVTSADVLRTSDQALNVKLQRENPSFTWGGVLAHALIVRRDVVQRLRKLKADARGLAVVAVLFALLFLSYPFQPHSLLMFTAELMICVVASGYLYAYWVLDRDEVISYILGSTPRQLDLNSGLVTQLGPYSLLLVGILVSHAFPEVWQWFRDVASSLLPESR